MWVAGQMGHADWAMIRKVYGRWIPEVDPTAGRRITAMLEHESCDHPVTKQSPFVTKPTQNALQQKKASAEGKALADKGLDGLERSAQGEFIGGGCDDHIAL